MFSTLLSLAKNIRGYLPNGDPSMKMSTMTSIITSDTELSEVIGDHLKCRNSIYLLLEQGMAKSLHRPAVVSLHQSADHFLELLASSAKVSVQRDQLSMTESRPRRNNKLTHNRADLEQNGVNGTKEQNCLVVSYSQIHLMAQDLAAGMESIGVQPETTVLILIPNGAEYGLLLWTCILLRLAIVCASGTEDLCSLLRSVKPSVVVVASAEAAIAVDNTVANFQLAPPARVFGCPQDAPDGWSSLVQLLLDGSKSSARRQNLLEDARSDIPERLHSVLYTSGTSGQPKGCPLRVGNMTHVLKSQSWLLNEDACRSALQQAHPSRGIAPAQTLQTWSAGGAVVMTGQGFHVQDAAAAIKDHGASFLVLTPPMVHELALELKARPFNVSSVRSIQIGGDAVTKSVLTRCAAIFPSAKIFVNHGMSEGGGIFIWPFFDMAVDCIPYFGEMCPVGKVTKGASIRIWDSDNKRLSRHGEAGDLHVCCNSTIHHYHAGASESSFYDDKIGRWFITGDIAMMNSEGLVYILGRSKDMIRRCGFVVMPAPLESCIEELTGQATAVVSVRDRSRRESQVFAVLRSLDGVDADSVKTHVGRSLGHHYVPSSLLSLLQLGLTKFPTNNTHKIVKDEVQKAVLRYTRAQPECGIRLM